MTRWQAFLFGFASMFALVAGGIAYGLNTRPGAHINVFGSKW